MALFEPKPLFMEQPQMLSPMKMAPLKGKSQICLSEMPVRKQNKKFKADSPILLTREQQQMGRVENLDSIRGKMILKYS